MNYKIRRIGRRIGCAALILGTIGLLAGGIIYSASRPSDLEGSVQQDGRDYFCWIDKTGTSSRFVGVGTMDRGLPDGSIKMVEFSDKKWDSAGREPYWHEADRISVSLEGGFLGSHCDFFGTGFGTPEQEILGPYKSRCSEGIQQRALEMIASCESVAQPPSR